MEKPLTELVTERFLLVKETVLSKRRSYGIINDSQFAAAMGISRQVFTQLGNPKYGRNVTLEMAAELCKLYDINGDWLLNGKGEMFRKPAKPEKEDPSLAKRLEAVEKLLKGAGAAKKTAKKK